MDSVYIIEDEVTTANNIKEVVSKRHANCNYHLIHNLEEYKSVKDNISLSTNDESRMFLIDLSLAKKSTNDDGTIIIKDIRTYDTSSVILAYSAFTERMENSKNCGANYFKPKKSGKKQFKNLIDFIENLIHTSAMEKDNDNLISYRDELLAIISHINEKEDIIEMRLQNPIDSDEIEYMNFPFSRFKNMENLKVNRVFKVIFNASSNGGASYYFEDTNEDFNYPKENYEINKIGYEFDDVTERN